MYKNPFRSDFRICIFKIEIEHNFFGDKKNYLYISLFFLLVFIVTRHYQYLYNIYTLHNGNKLPPQRVGIYLFYTYTYIYYIYVCVRGVCG